MYVIILELHAIRSCCDKLRLFIIDNIHTTSTLKPVQTRFIQTSRMQISRDTFDDLTKSSSLAGVTSNEDVWFVIKHLVDVFRKLEHVQISCV